MRILLENLFFSLFANWTFKTLKLPIIVQQNKKIIHLAECAVLKYFRPQKMANQSSVKNTTENNEALNFASVDQELNSIRQGKKKKKLFRRQPVCSQASTSLSLWGAVRLGSCQSASLVQTHAKESELEYDYD